MDLLSRKGKVPFTNFESESARNMSELKVLEGLDPTEKEKLLQAPVLVSLLAAVEDGTIKEKEKRDAIKLSHLRPFTSPDMLHPYYEAVEERFEDDLDKILKELPPGPEEKKKELNQAVQEIEPIVQKIGDQDFADELRRSLKSYGDHVMRSDQSVVEYFVLPLAIASFEKQGGE